MKKATVIIAALFITLQGFSQSEDCRTKISYSGTTLTIKNKEKATMYVIARPGEANDTTCVVAQGCSIQVCILFCTVSVTPITNWPCSCTFNAVTLDNHCILTPVKYTGVKAFNGFGYVTLENSEGVRKVTLMKSLNGKVFTPVGSVEQKYIPINRVVKIKL